MTQLFARCLSICALLVISLFFSACADNNKSAGLHLSTDQELVTSSAPPEAEDPDSDLKSELEALQRAGSWNTPRKTTQNQLEEFDQTISDFPLIMNNQVQAYLDLFQNQQRKSFSIWLSRSSKYLPLMQRELKEAGLPQDLAYLAMIESGFNQKAYSRADASGLWQFIPGTGTLYNLEMNRYLDERRDAEKSTKAAVKFLSELYDSFGDWHLAVAAYNAGPGKISKGIEKYNVNDFWTLAEYDYLAMETKRYVPKLIAAIIIAKNPEKYGFTDIQFEQPSPFETIDVGPGMPLDAVALISNCDTKTICQLNQELSTDKTPANKTSYRIKIPKGTREVACKNLPRLHRTVSTDYKTHTIKKGETLSKICDRYNINKTTLLKTNNLRDQKLSPGQHLRIPFQTAQYRLLSENSEKALAAVNKENLILHRINKGETLSSISKKYNVPIELLVDWNELGSKQSLKIGQQLAVYTDQKKAAPNTSPGRVVASLSPANEKNVIIADQSKKVSTASASNNIVSANNNSMENEKKSHWYQVQNGDTLWTIAKEFKLSPLQIKQMNNLQSNTIHPGKRLKIKDV